MNFTSKIESRNVSIYDLDKHFPKLKGLQNGSDYEIEPGEFIVKWNFEIESREWGVKDMSWYVTDIGGNFDIVYFDENGDEKERESIEFEPDLFRDAFEMENDLDDRSVSVNDIEIDYAAKSVLVS